MLPPPLQPPTMALPATPGPRKIRRGNPNSQSPRANTTKTKPTVKPSVSTPPANRTASRYKPMTIRVVTSDDERLSSDNASSSSDAEEADLASLDSDDDVFMPIIQAATVVPMKMQRAKTTQRQKTRSRRPASPLAAASFPPALLAFLQDDTDIAQFAHFSTGFLDDGFTNTTTAVNVNANRAVIPAAAPPRYEPLSNGGPPSMTSLPARLPGATTDATGASMANTAASSIAGRLQDAPNAFPAAHMNHMNNMGAAPLARHELVESYVPAPLCIEKKTPTAATPTTSSTLVQQSTEDFVRRTDRSMARQQAQVQAMQQPHQQPYPSQHHAHPPQYVQQVQQQRQRRPSAKAPTPAPVAMVRERAASWSNQAPQQQQGPPQQSPYTTYSTYTTQMSQMNMGYTPQHHHHHRPHHNTGGGPRQPFQWQRPAPIKPVKPMRRRAPGEMFAALPGEVLELILDELKKLHLQDTSARTGTHSNHKSCATCWMRDAGAMAVTARKMLKYARVALYESIEIAGADHSAAVLPKRKYKTQRDKDHAQQTLVLSSSRLALLQRTLRESPQIAAIVRTLQVPPTFSSPSLTAPTPSLADEYETLVSSVVTACPNLERVVGYYPAYDHAVHSRFAQALSTRTRLKEAHWVVAPLLSPEQKEQQAREQREKEELLVLQAASQRSRSRSKSFSHIRSRPASPPSLPSLPSPPVSPKLDQDANGGVFASLSTTTALVPRQSARFLNHHIHWQYLSTLTIHCQPGATLTPTTLLVDALMYLPALQNLYLSHLPAAAFDDSTLLALPPLKKLALVHLPGLTADGLSNYATRGTSRSLTSLSLVHVALDALPAMARLLSKLDRLTTLNVVQPQAPALTPGEVIWLFPYLASPSIQKLHWDVVQSAAAPGSPKAGLTGDVVLARSIEAGGFPALRQLRTPVDPEGLFQGLCRPQERVDLPRDRYRSLGTYYPAAFSSQGAPATASSPPSASHRHRHSESSSSIFSSSYVGHSRSNSSASFTFSKSSSPSSASSSSSASAASTSSTAEWTCSNLQQARTAAQARIDASRRSPRVFVNVTDEHGRLVDKYGLAGFVGTVGSPITYHLVPDAGASDEKGGLVDMADFLGESEEKKETASNVNSSEDVCTGQWNANWEVPLKKDKERWWHSERTRTRTVKLI